jgi:hypothetical protein
MFIKYVSEILRRETLKIRYKIDVLRQSVYNDHNEIVNNSRH